MTDTPLYELKYTFGTYEIIAKFEAHNIEVLRERLGGFLKATSFTEDSINRLFGEEE